MTINWPTAQGLCLLAVCAFCTVTGCSDRPQPSVTDERLKVLATVGMVADVVREISGDHVQVVQLMGSGVDPHLYKATRDDVRRIITADVIFTSGLMLEGRLQDVFDKISKRRPVFAMTGGIPSDRLLSADDADGHPDPHVWMDVAQWAACLDVLTDGLSQLVPSAAGTFRANADSYRLRLMQLHEYGVKCMASIPADQRILVTSHDAFHYFGRAYGLEVVGVQGLSTESEAGLQRINELVDMLVDRRIAAVFVESSVPQKNIFALIDGANSRGHNVRIGGELYSDAMGSPGTYEGTYVGMLDFNITTVTRALGGTAPERGLFGKLAGPEKPE
jgi:manganese/zinc/iron transport system substrate-binding protein